MNSALVIVAFALCSLNSFGAPLIGGTLKILSTTTNQELTSVRIGRPFKVMISERDLHLLANKNVTISYLFSVVPRGSSTPISFSGKFTCRATLPPTEGGVAETNRGVVFLAGDQSAETILTAPDLTPEGLGTLSISIGATGVDTIYLSKSINVRL